MGATEAYIQAAHHAGCSQEQITRFISSGYVALPHFLPFHVTAEQIGRNGVTQILLDGTRGSAKSHAVIAQVGLDDCQVYPGLKWLFLRKTQKAASESFDDLVARVLQGIPHTQNSEKVTFPNGSKIVIGGYNDDRDIQKYVGIEYDGIVIEEATQIKGEQHDLIEGSLRTSKDNWVPRMYLSTNPGGIGHQHIKTRFIEPQRNGTETKTRRFFSSYLDNPFINQEYKAYLESLTGDIAKAWRDGDWDIFAGQAFSAWRYEKHVITQMPDGWERWAKWRAVDWGYSAPWCCLWITRNPDNGRIYVYREAYETQLTDKQQARMINDLTEERIALTYADPSMWATKNMEGLVSSTADEYASNDVLLTKADNDRLSGKRKVDRLLEPLPDGLPGLQVFAGCVNLIRTLPALVYDDVHTEDIDTKQEDHCLIAGTMVTTSEGDKPIEEVNIGDMVLTRRGYRRVIRSWLTQKKAQVYQVDFSDGQRLIGTAGHPVFVKTCGFVNIDALKRDDEIITLSEANKWQRLLSLMASSSGDIQKQQTGHQEHITRRQVHIVSKGLVSYIKRFGEASMVIFQKGIIYITRMAMRSTIVLRIWNVFLHTTIYQYIKINICRMLNIWRVSDHWLPSGTGQTKVVPGTDYTQHNRKPKSFCGAITAVKNTLVGCIRYITSVLLPAIPLLEGGQELMTSRKFAPFVDMHLQRTSTVMSKPAHDCVVRVTGLCKLAERLDVYNLEIEDEHEFFANGVLVHNCYDALRYGLTQARDYTPHRKLRATDSPWAKL